jgi:hypothetical protein
MLQSMIVNVNPYDTGFDENSHVMRFASIAREVSTVAFPRMGRTSSLSKQPVTFDSSAQATTQTSEVHRRRVTLSHGGGDGRKSLTLLEVLEGALTFTSL